MRNILNAFKKCYINTFIPNDKNIKAEYWDNMNNYLSSYLVYEGEDRLISNIQFDNKYTEGNKSLIVLNNEDITKLKKVLYKLYKKFDIFIENNFDVYSILDKEKQEMIYQWVKDVDEKFDIDVLASSSDFNPYSLLLIDWVKEMYNLISKIKDRYLLIMIIHDGTT